MNRPAPKFQRPTLPERLFNRAFGIMIGLGLGLGHNHLVEVRGRKSGQLYSAPVDLLEMDGRRYLVCPRGRSQWVRNAEAAGQVALRKGSARTEYATRLVSDADKPAILKAYLDRFKLTVQRYFPLSAGSPAAAFAEYTERYPVFELLPLARPAKLPG